MDHLAFAQLLGNYGEFVGAIAVVVTLGYLAVQIRQNTAQLRENLKSLKRTEQRSAYEQHDRYRVATLAPELANLFLKGIDGGLTDPADRYRFNNLMLMVTYSAQNNWDLVDASLDSDDEGWIRIASNIAALYDSPGGKNWWERSRSTLKPGFVQAVEALRTPSG